MGRCKLTVTDEELRVLYCDDGLRLKDIAAKFDCTAGAVSIRFKKAGIQCRKNTDYPTLDRVREAWIEIGKRGKGRHMTEEQKAKLSESKKGRRARDDYEFGGHEKKRTDGYIKVYVPDHPNCTSDGYVMKHILVVERMIGRHLTKDECVHHINHIRDDNRPENLKLMTKAEHMSMHMKERHANRRAKLC